MYRGYNLRYREMGLLVKVEAIPRFHGIFSTAALYVYIEELERSVNESFMADEVTSVHEKQKTLIRFR